MKPTVEQIKAETAHQLTLIPEIIPSPDRTTVAAVWAREALMGQEAPARLPQEQAAVERVISQDVLIGMDL